jgi:hypothetical protein
MLVSVIVVGGRVSRVEKAGLSLSRCIHGDLNALARYVGDFMILRLTLGITDESSFSSRFRVT